jgi:hypothetical protein
MKKLVSSLMTLSVLFALSVGASAQQKNIEERIVFGSDVFVGGTLVKSGSYKVKFDRETGMVKILDDNDVLATSKATVKMNEDKAENDAILTTRSPEGTKLTGLRLAGQREEIVISEAVATETLNL